ncbi:MAG TPA: twin-arginine translocation signal domain-containing protein [Opitutaceae bacterium]|nr:twin-arginine translocation signal domain-containing protein [Opitutaceae bacterium]
MNRRTFLRLVGAAGTGLALGGPELLGQGSPAEAALALRRFGRRQAPVPDEGWNIWPDVEAPWKDDRIFLPADVDLAALPAHPPTGGWEMLDRTRDRVVTLPATIEQFHWGMTGFRQYRDEYKFEATDDEVRNGAYYGVSWWWRDLELPADFIGKRILLHVRAARQRAEVYLNRRLVGYSILEELPFTCDLSGAARAGRNQLAIRITNPGGRLDWVDGSRLNWAGLQFQKSHGFGGLDRGLMVSAHGPVRIADSWVLNRPEPRTITAFAALEGRAAGRVRFAVVDPASGRVLASRERPAPAAGEEGPLSAELAAPSAEIWDLDHPRLYALRTEWIPDDPAAEGDLRELAFGFRWFAAEGIGGDALFRLNGRRIRLYTSISWGFWALNGLFPTPEMAEREVAAAKGFNLNALNFHRNLAKEEVLDIQDRRGLLRCLEPGGGSQAVPPRGRAPGFPERYMEAKILGMIRAFRSHPSVVHYIIQNEGRLDQDSPALLALFAAMRAEDPSRSIVGTDGFVMRNTEIWEQAYSGRVLRSEKPATAEGGAAGWWVDHSGHATDVWQDGCYLGPRDYYYRSPVRGEVVEWGEMKGPASSDDHQAMLRRIRAHGGDSYDTLDHREILAAYDAFLDRWGFRGAFPTASALFRSIGKRAYGSWGQLMENVRISDETDMAAISGWESTAMENHSGLVDNFREYKSDPGPIAESLQPVRPVAKQRHLTLFQGEGTRFDLYLLNDSGRPVAGELVFTLSDPAGREALRRTCAAPDHHPDRLSYLLQEGVDTGPLAAPGLWRSRFELAGHPASAHEREILVVAPAAPKRDLRVGLVEVPPALASAIAGLAGVSAAPFAAGGGCDVIVLGGGAPSKEARVDADGADLAGPSRAAGGVPPAVLEALRGGTALLGLAAADAPAQALARDLAAAGAFRFDGMVGTSRASWMGAWYFVRPHELYAGMPAGEALGLHYQVKSGGANGWRVEGGGVEVVAGYGRDHDRNLGAGTLTARLGRSRLVLHQILGMHPALLRRFLGNALNYLAG